MCSLHGLTAWTRPEPTKWAAVVIFCARATHRENEVFSRPKLASRDRAPSLTTTAHFVGPGHFQVLTSHAYLIPVQYTHFHDFLFMGLDIGVHDTPRSRNPFRTHGTHAD